MLGGLCYLMFTTKRQLTMFVLICSMILNKSLVELVQLYTKTEIKEITEKATKPLIALAITVVMLSFSYYMIKGKLDDEFISSTDYPVAACDYIVNNIDLGRARFYNEYNYGSYLLYRGIPVFIDSRADLYAPEFSGKEDDIFMDFIDTSNIGRFYEDTMQKYGITHVITYKNSKMNMIIVDTHDEKYKELYSDDNFVIYERIANK